MKTANQIEHARRVLQDKLQISGLSDAQRTLLGGMLNALVWVADGPNSSTIDRLLSGEEVAAGKDAGPALERLRAMEANRVGFTCPKCRQLMAHSRLRGMFCMTCG